MKQKKKNKKTNRAIKPAIKRLFFDIETTPIICWAWTLGYNQTITQDQLIQEAKIICISYKWQHESSAHTLVWDFDQDTRTGDDSGLLAEFIELYNEADEVVYHNGKKFDMGWIRKEILQHRLGTLPLRKDYDTYKLARTYLRMHSNSLRYIAGFLDVGAKLRVGTDVWKRVTFKGCEDALQTMVEYCERDVLVLEQVWNEIVKVAGKPQTHVGVLNGKPKWTCPWDGSTNVIRNKKLVTAKGTLQFEMKCLECERTFVVSKKVYEDYLHNKYGY